jgi:beta-aspartyl-peptidase (threonine type)
MRWLGLLILVACAASPPVRRFQPMDQSAVTKVIEDQAAAWNRGDLAAYMEGYAKTDALVFTSGGHVRKGWTEAFAHYQKRYGSDPKAMGHLEFGVTQVDAVGADAAVVLGTWKLTRSEHPGEGVFTLVFERRPEGWRIVHDHTSAISP